MASSASPAERGESTSGGEVLDMPAPSPRCRRTLGVFCSPTPTSMMGQPCHPSWSVRSAAMPFAPTVCSSSITSTSAWPFHIRPLRSCIVRCNRPPRLACGCGPRSFERPPPVPATVRLTPVVLLVAPSALRAALPAPIAEAMAMNASASSSNAGVPIVNPRMRRPYLPTGASIAACENTDASSVLPAPGTPVMRTRPSRGDPVAHSAVNRSCNARSSAFRPAKWIAGPRSS